MMLQATPTVPHVSSPSADVIRTRVFAGGAARLVEDAHLVVDQVHLPEVRVELLQGLPERVVQRVHRPVAGRGGVLGDPLDLDADRRLRERLPVVAAGLDDDAIALEVEVGAMVPEGSLHQELERGLGALELVALVLEPLQGLEDPAGLRRVLLEVDPVLPRLPQDVRLPGQLGDEDPPVVAHQLGRDVLVRLGVLEDRRDVHPGLVREGGVPDERLVLPGRAVRQLRGEARHVAQLAEAHVRDRLEPELQRQVRDDRHEVGVPAALPEPVERPLDVLGPLHAPPPASSRPRTRRRCGRGSRAASGRAAAPRARSRPPPTGACRRSCRRARGTGPRRARPPAASRARTPGRASIRRRSARRRRRPPRRGG